MPYPSLEINLKKLESNTRILMEACGKHGIEIATISKVYCGDKHIAGMMVDCGVKIIGDSRISNLIKIKDLPCERLLLRLPMLSEVSLAVEYCDISLNSELRTIRALNEAAAQKGRVHSIILMIDLGDLREGMLPEEISDAVSEIIKLKNIILLGIGTNLTCYGGVIPDEKNLGALVELRNNIERKFHIKLPLVSGGNSSSLPLMLEGKVPEGINNLRIGEAIALGRETAYGNNILSLFTDTFILKGEIIELKEKPSLPQGTIGMDAFGNKPTFVDKGIRKRAILALGKQDVTPEGLQPVNKDIEIIGASSDHLLLDMTNSKKAYAIGDLVEFTLSYGALLSVMTSEYVHKYYVR